MIALPVDSSTRAVAETDDSQMNGQLGFGTD